MCSWPACAYRLIGREDLADLATTPLDPLNTAKKHKTRQVGDLANLPSQAQGGAGLGASEQRPQANGPTGQPTAAQPKRGKEQDDGTGPQQETRGGRHHHRCYSQVSESPIHTVPFSVSLSVMIRQGSGAGGGHGGGWATAGGASVQATVREGRANGGGVPTPQHQQATLPQGRRQSLDGSAMDESIRTRQC